MTLTDRLGRHHKLFIAAATLLAAVIASGHALDGRLSLDEFRHALGPLAALPLLAVFLGPSPVRRVTALIVALLLVGTASQRALGPTTLDFAAQTTLGAWSLFTLFTIAVLFAFGVVLSRAWRAQRHPDPWVSAAGVTAVMALAAPGAAILAWGGEGEDAAPLLYGLFASAGWILIEAARKRWLAHATRRGVTLSVSVICRDEADRIGRCLDAVHGWADQIVVLDSGSTDGTVAVARRFTDEVTVTDWPGYGVQKQRALERCTGDWVLSLDADEVISADLKREIDATLTGDHGCSAFKNPWVSVLFGGPIDFGADGRYHTRLFRRSAARFDGAAVHEEVVSTGRVGTLESPVYHYTFRDRAHLDRKFAEYARLSAESRFAKGKRATRLGALVRGGVSFLLLYVLRLGVLDGRRGLLMAGLYARYTHDKYAGLVALERAQGSGPPR